MRSSSDMLLPAFILMNAIIIGAGITLVEIQSRVNTVLMNPAPESAQDLLQQTQPLEATIYETQRKIQELENRKPHDPPYYEEKARLQAELTSLTQTLAKKMIQEDQRNRESDAPPSTPYNQEQKVNTEPKSTDYTGGDPASVAYIVN